MKRKATKKAEEFYSKAVEEVEKSFREEHTPQQTALSFGVGSFLVLIPNFPIGLAALIAIAAFWKGSNEYALFAPTVILNPIVKTGFYSASLYIGRQLPIELELEYLALGVDLFAGSLVAATAVSVIGYFVVYRLAENYRSI